MSLRTVGSQDKRRNVNTHESILEKAVKHARPRLFHWIVFRRNLEVPFPLIPNPAGAVVEKYDYYDLDAVCAQINHAECQSYLRHGHRKGQQCFLARVNGALAGMTFISHNPVIARKRLVLHLKSDQRYSGNSFVLPKFRGNKIFHHLKIESYRAQVPLGIRYVFNMVAIKNQASIRTHQNLSAEPVNRFNIVGWLLLNFSWNRPISDHKARQRQ